MMGQEYTFEQWKARVDRALAASIGFDSGDLPDFPSRDYYNDGVSPTEAIEMAIEDGWWADLEGIW